MAIRLDAHNHYWHYNETDYGWMSDDQRILKQDYLPAHLEPSLRENGLHGTVVIQARQVPGETDFLLELKAANDFVRGIVGWADLAASDAGAQLESLVGRVNGFRHQLEDEPDPEFMLSRAFKNGIGALARGNFTYDLLIRPAHLKAAARLADAFPNQPFVVDHLAKPVLTDDGYLAWKDDFAQLALRQNVMCKLSGMVTETAISDWQEEEINIDPYLPFLELALESFGQDRLMFGSDWPVCTLSATYNEVYDIVQLFIDKLSASEQEAIMGRTAAAFYGIEHS